MATKRETYFKNVGVYVDTFELMEKISKECGIPKAIQARKAMEIYHSQLKSKSITKM